MFKKDKYTIYFLAFIFGFSSCTKTAELTDDVLLAKTIDAHGGKYLFGKNISFDFRDHSYTLYRDSASYVYTRRKDSVEDILHSESGFSRRVHGHEVSVVDSMVVKYSNSVNSVLYFFQLPLVLNDEAVQKEYLGSIVIKEQKYHAMKVTFRQEGGGEDFEDEFRYWINADTFEIDYLAYSYLTDGGGVRFREAFRKERIENVLFQDYRNFRPEHKTVPLDSLPRLFEKGSLELLSLIENRNIQIAPFN